MSYLNSIIYDKILNIYNKSPLLFLPKDFGGKVYLDIPQMGVADGNDEIFLQFKEELSFDHLNPTEIWRRYDCPMSLEIIQNLRVIVVVYPYTKEIKKAKNISSNHPSKIFHLARNYAKYFIANGSEQLCAFFRTMGYLAISPTVYSLLNVSENEKNYGGWSDRHCAYVAGLGTLSLQNALITRNGCNNRICSIITNAPLEITPRVIDNPNGLCSFYRIHSCGTCKRCCPVGAITNEGLEFEKCESYCKKVNKEMNTILEPYLRQISFRKKSVVKTSTDFPVGCAMCQIKVPCTSRIPKKLQFKVGKNNLFGNTKEK